MKKSILVLLLLFIPNIALAATYYVDSEVTDTNVASATPDFTTYNPVTFATDTGSSSVYKTIADVNAKSFSAGDFVYFRKGQTWREQLTVPSSGSAGNPITFGAYGSGDDPIVKGVSIVTPGTSWTNVAGLSAVLTNFEGAAAKNMFNVTSQQKWGNEFLAPKDFSVESITVQLKKTGSPTGNLWIEIYGDTASAPGSLLGQSDNLDASTLTTSFANKAFHFSTPVALTNGTKYYAILAGDVAVHAVNYIISQGDNSGGAEAWVLGLWRWTPWAEQTGGFGLNMIIYESTATSVWTATVTTEPKVVLFDDHYGYIQATQAAVNSEYDWYWASNVLYVYAASDPDTLYTSPGIEVGNVNKTLWVNGKSYLEFDHLNFSVSNQYLVHLEGDNTTHHIAFTNCTFQNGFEYNVVPTTAHTITDITLTDCSSARSGSFGVVFTNKTGWTLTRVTSYRDGIVAAAFGGETWGGGLKINGATDDIIQNCEVSYAGIRDDGYTPDLTNKGYGIWADSDTAAEGHGAIIRYNSTHHNAVSGLFIEKTHYAEVYYNISFANTEYGLRVGTDDANTCENGVFYNNVLYGNAIGIYAYNDAGTNAGAINNLFKNNIATGNATRQATFKDGFHNDGTDGSGNVYDYNCFGVEGENFIEWGEGVYKSTYDLWETAYGGTTHSVEADPLFVNAAGGDFSIKSTSPCKDTGTNVSLTSDYVGNPVPNGAGYDIGAIEYYNFVNKGTTTTGVTIQ